MLDLLRFEPIKLVVVVNKIFKGLCKSELFSFPIKHSYLFIVVAKSDLNRITIVYL